MPPPRLKRSNTANSTPSSLEDGEIAINQADGRLFYRTASGGVAALAGGGSSYTLPTATASVLGGVKIGAGLSIANGVVSVVAASSTDSRLDLFLPTAPTSVSASGADGQAAVTWTAPTVLAQTPITDYVVQYSSNAGSTWATFADGTSTNTSTTVTGLTNGTAYVFRVAAVTGIGQGAWSSASSAATPSSFSPSAVILTSGTSYTVPVGASTMKAWAVGPGGMNGSGIGHAGAVCYKAWSVTGGSSVTFALGTRPAYDGNCYRSTSTTVTYGGVTITAQGGSGTNTGDSGAATYSGGDGGANGGLGGYPPQGGASGGAVGGNGAVVTPCNRYSATDVSGLFAAVTMAGGTVTETCADTAAFGSGGASNSDKRPGIGGGGAWSGTGGSDYGGVGAVVLYFS